MTFHILRKQFQSSRGTFARDWKLIGIVKAKYQGALRISSIRRIIAVTVKRTLLVFSASKTAHRII